MYVFYILDVYIAVCFCVNFIIKYKSDVQVDYINPRILTSMSCMMTNTDV